MSFFTAPEALREQMKIAEEQGLDEVVAIVPWIDLSLDRGDAINQIAEVGGLA
jgi:hypothetical protein